LSADSASSPEAPLPASVRRPYALYPAITYPHKNHLVLLEAFASLAEAEELQLVLIGGAGASEAAVLDRMAANDLRDRVVRLGRVPSAVRTALIGNAAMVVVPSRYEGFGLPALEAMAAGVPVIVSDIPALAEVVAATAPRVGVDDVAGWCTAIGLLAADGPRRAELSAAGLTEAAAFTPQRTAAAMIDVWQRAAATTTS
jgi:alpha-1,3-rhamnosyl/mannosyltransferase